MSSSVSSDMMVRLSGSRPAKLYMRWVQENGSMSATLKLNGAGL